MRNTQLFTSSQPLPIMAFGKNGFFYPGIVLERIKIQDLLAYSLLYLTLYVEAQMVILDSVESGIEPLS